MLSARLDDNDNDDLLYLFIDSYITKNHFHIFKI